MILWFQIVLKKVICLVKVFFLTLKRVWSFFSKGLDDPYLEAMQSTKKLEIKFDELDNTYINFCDDSKPEEQKRDWKECFGKPLFNIYWSMRKICNLNKEVPLKDLFDSPWMLNDYNKFINALEKFTFAENDETKK